MQIAHVYFVFTNLVSSIVQIEEISDSNPLRVQSNSEEGALLRVEQNDA